MTEQLADLLDQYLTATGLPPAYVDSEGIFTLEPSAGLRVGAVMLADGRLELFSNPGHVSAVTLRNLIEAGLPDALDHEAVPGALVRWKTDGAHWGVHVDRETARLTLTKFIARLPWHPDVLAAVFGAFCEEHAELGRAAGARATGRASAMPACGWRSSIPSLSLAPERATTCRSPPG